MHRKLLALGGTVSLALLAGCAGPRTDAQGFVIDPDFEKTLQGKLIDAKPGDVVTIPAGKYALSRSLSLIANGVTVKGAGMDKTILSFAKATSGAEGMLVTGDDFTIQDLAFEDSKGDALKINGTRNAVMRRVRASWSGGSKSSNGAYGLYPVQVTNVLIENSVVKGASDAGIYVVVVAEGVDLAGGVGRGVADDHVDAAEPVRRDRDEVGDALAVGDVRRHRDDMVGGSTLGGLGEGVLATTGEDDVAALADEGPRDRLPDARTGAGHDDRASGQAVVPRRPVVHSRPVLHNMPLGSGRTLARRNSVVTHGPDATPALLP
jgi:hypothetical protein